MTNRLTLLGILLLGAITANSQQLSCDARGWYDIDGDGAMESIANGTICRINPDGSITRLKVGSLSGSFGSYFVRLAGNLPVIAMQGSYQRAQAINEDFSIINLNLPYRESPTSQNFYSFYPVDYDNSGRKGLVRKDVYATTLDGTAFSFIDGLSYYNDKLSILSWNEYYNIRSELTLSGGSNPLEFNNVVRSTPGVYYAGFTSLDINGDGLPDLIDGTKGLYYLNTGLGSYVENNFGGQTEIRDLNGDGFADMVVYDSSDKTVTVEITRYGSTPVVTELLSGYPCGKRIWCYDFDHDGDVDILVPINNSSSVSDAFLIFYENDGSGKFKQHEAVIEGMVTFIDCLDIDVDGKYEVTATSPSDTDGYTLRAYKIDGPKISGKYEVALQADLGERHYFREMWWGNIDDTGLMRTVITTEYSNRYYSSIYTVSDKVNKRPSAPGKPIATLMPGTNLLKINWSAGNDAETPTADLTYEVRVGTAPGLDDIVVADALADGRRRSPQPGANGYLCYRTFDVSTWPAGKCYISVQCVDQNMGGSPFSEYTVFEKAAPAADFTIEMADYAGAGDTITARVKSNFNETFSWDLGDGEILETVDNGKTCLFRYPTGGKKEVKLITSLNGVTATKSRTIEVLPVSISRNNESFRNYSFSVLDLDADGSEELIYNSAFFEQDSEGNIKTVSKLWNTNLPSVNRAKPVDVNKDGLVDVLFASDYSKSFLITNNGDKNVSVSELTDFDVNWEQFADFDNDGELESISGSELIRTTAGEISGRKSLNLPQNSIVRDLTYDYNGDGLLDIVVAPGYYQSAYVYLNNGNDTFTKSDIEIKYHSELKAYGLPVAVGDYDFDGKADFIYNGSSSFHGASTYVEHIEVVFGNGRCVTVQCLDGRPFGGIGVAIDIDNDGMQEISTNGILHFNSDYTYEIFDFPEFLSYSSTLLHRNNGDMLGNGGIDIKHVKNDKPTVPTDVRAKVAGDFVYLEWNPASDKETPAAGLRYNISVKRKGADGEGAYVLSPMNMERNGVNVPSDHRLYTAPRTKIPLRALASGEYEVRVQAVDALYVAGDFSEPYTFAVRDYVKVDAPTSVMAGNETIVKIISNKAVSSVDFGEGAEYTALSEQQYAVVWTTTGQKNLSVNNEVVGGLYVYPEIDASFELPGSVLSGARINIDCATAGRGRWESVDASGTSVELIESDYVSGLQTSENSISFVVEADCDFTLRHTITESYGESAYEQECKVATDNVAPQIRYVGVADGMNTLYWSAPGLPEGSSKVNVYRETSRLNVYELIGQTEAADGMFADKASVPDMKTERYQITTVLPYGESAASQPHQPMHLILNKGVGEAINLMWSKYEGFDVETYNIYSGNSAEDLSLENSVSGNKTSYVSKSPSAFYAVEIVAPSATVSRSGDNDVVRSNVVAAANAYDAKVATAIEIVALGGSNVLDLAQNDYLELCAILQPAGTTFGDVDWQIVEGADFATIDTRGRLTASKLGTVVVSATTRDGSDLTAQYTVEVDFIDVPITSLEFTAWPENLCIAIGEQFRFKVKIAPDNTTETPTWRSSRTNVATIDSDGVLTGVAEGSTVITARSALNNAVYAQIEIDVKGVAVPVESITLSESQIVGFPGDKFTITTELLPENASAKTVEWKSEPSTTNVFKVTRKSSSLIEISLEKPGSATIIAHARYGTEKTADAKLEVVVKEQSAIDSIVASQEPFDIYNLQGCLILADANEADLAKLLPGIYLIRQNGITAKYIAQ